MALTDQFRVDGQVAIVTGAGRGIGAASAIALAEAGADVVIAARTPGELQATAEAIRATGRRACVVVADLADLGQAPRLVAKARDGFGRLDIIVSTPLRRLGTVQDIAAAVVYLASPAGAYLTGAVLEVAGGLQAPATGPPAPDL